LVGSAQSIDYEEVLCVSVPLRMDADSEQNYACIKDTVICQPPCSVGIINNVSLDTSNCNDNVSHPEPNGNVKSVQDADVQNGSGSNESSDVSSASSSINDQNHVEVKYVADIRQFRSVQTIVRPHGEDCSCPMCQSVNGDLDRTEHDRLIHNSSDLKCSCKLCREFHSKMQCISTSGGFTTTVGVNAFSNQYRFISSVAQNVESIPFTWSQSSSEFKATFRIAECDKHDSQNVWPLGESASVSADYSDVVFGAFTPEEADDDNGLFSSDDELHYVFHKFIDHSCLDEPFSDASPDETLCPSVVSSKVTQSEPGEELQSTAARSADDLEVAFFMVGDISPCSPSTLFPDVTPTVPASVAVSAGHKTDVTEDTVMSETEIAARLSDTEASAYNVHEMSTVGNDFKPHSVNVVCQDVETDTSFANGAVPSELMDLSGALRSEASGLETDLVIDSNLNVLDNENEWTCYVSDSNEMQWDIIVQELSESSSLFIEFSAADTELVSADYMSISIPAGVDDAYTIEEFAPAIVGVVVERSSEIVTAECVTERPVSTDEVVSLQTLDDISSQHGEQHLTISVASYIRDIVEKAMQQIAADASSASVRICNVVSKEEELPKQIFITNAPLPSSPAEDEYDRQFDVSSDLELPSATEADDYHTVGTVDVGIVDADADNSCSDEIVCMTNIEAEEVPRVENYLISYDAHMSQQPVTDSADLSDKQTLTWASHPTCPNKSIAYGDVKVQYLVQPLEHVMSKNVGDMTDCEFSLNLEDHLTCDRGAGQAFPIDIVEDFFKQYVLPVDSVRYRTDTDTAAVVDLDGEQCDDATDQPKVDQNEEDIILDEMLETTAESIVDVVISDALVEINVVAATASAAAGVSCEEVSWDLEGLVETAELEDISQAKLDVIIVDVSDSLTTGPTLLPTAAGEDAQMLVPVRSGCLLHSPTESHRKKSVHFADTHGLQLETVQRYDQAPEQEESVASIEEFLSKLSAAAAERRAKWTEHHPSCASPWLCSSSIYLLACFELSASQEELLERVQHCHVALESCSFDDLALAISGVVRVANIAFHKKVMVRYSIDHWTSQTDIDGEYIPRSNDGTTDRFSFTIILPSRKQFVIGSEVEFAVCYVAGGDGRSFEFWDNNHGRNYIVRCCAKAATRDTKSEISGDNACSNENDDTE